MARYDFGLSWDEFEELTPKMFQALCKRRNVRIKYERYANAQTAAAVYNVNRHSADDPMVRPFDFIMDDEQASQRVSKIRFKKFIQKTIGQMPFGTPREKLLEVRSKAIGDLRASGCEDPEALFNEMWPSLKPKESES